MSNPRSRARAVTLLAAASLLLTACGGGSNIAEPTPLTELKAPAYRLHTLWRTDAGNGAGRYPSGFEPAVTAKRVFVANRDGYVSAIDMADGDIIWRSRTGESLIAGPGTANGVLVLGTRDGRVVALSAKTGKRLWDANLGSEVIAAPAASDDVAVARTLDGQLVAFDLASGQRRWSVKQSVPTLTLRGTSSPQIVADTVYAGLDNGKLIALDIDDGDQQWEQTVAVPSGRSELERIVDIDADPLVLDNAVYAVSVGGPLAALSPSSGRLRWKHDVASETGLAAAGDTLFTSARQSVVYAIDRASGNVDWQQDVLAYRKLSPPAIYRGDLLFGDLEGYLHWLATDDGSIIARGWAFDEAIRAAPVVVGNRIIVLGAYGEVAALRFTSTGR